MNKEFQLSPLDGELAEWCASVANDPYAFVMGAYPWREEGPLQDHDGPDIWQTEFLKNLGKSVKKNGFNGKHTVSAIREAVSSGHGIGKSTMVAWLVDWIMSTRPYCRGTITANTFTQLETKTWAAIQTWTKMCITSHWFVVTSNRMYQKDHKESWFCSPQSSKEDNSESFAGQHAETSTSFYIFDEASAIPDSIYEVAEGGLTDGEPMIFLFGNPTRNSGTFFNAVFGKLRARWHQTIIDSRKSRFTNKEQIKEWETDWGEDSDFFRVRVKGMAPNASDSQFIDHQRVLDAQKRVVYVPPDEPLVVGCDLAWGGADENVIRFRRGKDARSIPPIRIKGEFTREPSVLVLKLADVLSKEWNGRKVDMLFLDSAGIAGAIGPKLRAMGYTNIMEINFGADSPNDKRRFMRDHMWAEMKDWLLTGAIDAHSGLESDLTAPGMRNDNKHRIWLESKETMKRRGVDSPDDADALALTFAAPVSVNPVDHMIVPNMMRGYAWC